MRVLFKIGDSLDKGNLLVPGLSQILGDGHAGQYDQAVEQDKGAQLASGGGCSPWVDRYVGAAWHRA